MSDDLLRLTATQAVAELRAGTVSPTELLDAAMARIAAVEPVVNALPTRCEARAREAIRRLPADTGPGWLAGLPVAIKDLTPVAGVRTTYGSMLHAEDVPTRSGLPVERLEANGAVVVAKSNTPEFGAGASTFNDVFGATRNPWDLSRGVGGSSGGAAAALATGEVWLAHGSDLGGSLRTPAAMCGVVGLRPSPGRVARGPDGDVFDDAGVEGPMGRTVADTALLLDAMVGRDVRDPLSLDPPTTSFAEAVRTAQPPRRVAFTPDLAGFTPVDAEVAAICERAVRSLEALGTAVEPACPDLTGLYEVFHALRGQVFAGRGQQLAAADRDVVKPEIRWNVEVGERASGTDLAAARATRARLYQDVVAFLAERTVLAFPGAIVPAPPVTTRYLEEFAGHRFPTYIDWVQVTFLSTVVACPAIVVPAGFTATGLPVGLQLLGPPRGEATVLAVAALIEQQLGLHTGPIDPRAPG
jgi:amidase